MVKADRELYEPPYDDALMYDTVEEPTGPRGRPLIVLLGFVVLAAFAAVVWVAYQQGVKEGQRSNPPILSAESGPTRVTPEAQPTAAAIPADKSFERLSGEAEATTGDEQLMPAPEEPRPLPSPQDVTAAAPPATSMIAPPTAPIPAPTAAARPDSNHPGLDTTVSPVTPALPSAGQRMISSQATHSAGAASSEDLTSALPPSEVTAPTAIAPPPAAKPAKPKPVATPAPTPAPAETATDLPAGEGGPLETASLEASTAAAPPVAAGGPIAIQLGSFPTDVLAAQSWGKIKSANAAVLGEYSPKFQRAQVEGKGTWYRLQVTGFADKASAADVCNKLKANGQACIITTAK